MKTLIDEPVPPRLSSLHRRVRHWYRRWLVSRMQTEIGRQRAKMVWMVWGYRHLLSISRFSLRTRLRFLLAFVRIDWHVVHAHSPDEISAIARVLAERRAQPGESVVEAGCWRGGSTAKLSLLCAYQGFSLLVFDSFQGVEPSKPDGDYYDYSGEYSAPESEVRANVIRFGNIAVCSFFPGWFAETLAATPLRIPVRLAYIDCDLAKGTREVLLGILGVLSPDAVVFSQDLHIKPIRLVLRDLDTWGGRLPEFMVHTRRLVSIRLRRS